jgi:signal transduction histidine kinase
VKTVIEKMRSLRITTQMTVLVVAALAVAHMVIGLAIFSLYPRPMEPSSRAAPPQLEFVARLLAAISDVQQRAEIVRATRELIPELEIGALPLGTQRPMPGPRPDRSDPRLESPFKAFELMPDGPERHRLLAVSLGDGTALTVPFTPPPRPPGPDPILIGTMAFLISAVALISVWATHSLIAPLTRFADAAERFTLGRNDAMLPESGPVEIVSAARAFNQMRERIQRMVEDRAQMLAAVSHDLRTPITRLRLRAEEIDSSSLRKQVIRDLDSMQIMIRAALSFLREQATRVRQTRIDLPSLIQTVCDDCADAGRQVSFESFGHACVMGDPDQLTRAITNLVENGLKFGKAVSITMALSASSTVDIEVRDDGPGIPDREKSRVLEPFYRGDQARNLDDQDSFGLGLSISRVIAEAHSGSLSLHDATPHGLIARLTLPLADEKSNLLCSQAS